MFLLRMATLARCHGYKTLFSLLVMLRLIKLRRLSMPNNLAWSKSPNQETTKSHIGPDTDEFN
jgi:hypothetical protein